jgi:membrane protease YdiL (CAAX protease family)
MPFKSTVPRPDICAVAACPHCNGYVPADAQWCGQCANRLAPSFAAPVSTPAPYARTAAASTGTTYAEPPVADPVHDDAMADALPPGWRPPLPAQTEAPPARRPLGAAGRSTILVLVAIGVGAAGQWLIQRIALGGHANSQDLIDDGITLTVLLYVVVGGLVLGYVRKTKATLRWHEGDPVASVGAGLLRGVLLGAAVTGLLRAASGHLQGDSRFTDLISENNPIRIVFTMLLVIVAAPLVEETLFRGLLLESWRSLAGWSLVGSGFAFAAWHLNGSAIVYYWLIGLILGRVYLRRGLVGSMTAHASFNAVVLAVTIASVSGSGHTFHADGLRLHAPASWHIPAGTNSAQFGDAFVLEGPSGASFVIAAAADHERALSDGDATALAETQLHNFVTAAAIPVTGAPVPLDLALGVGEKVTITKDSQSADLYVIASPLHSYVVIVDTASSRTAASQVPAILRSLQED